MSSEVFEESKDNFLANLFLSARMKDFWKSVDLWWICEVV